MEQLRLFDFEMPSKGPTVVNTDENIDTSNVTAFVHPKQRKLNFWRPEENVSSCGKNKAARNDE